MYPTFAKGGRLMQDELVPSGVGVRLFHRFFARLVFFREDRKGEGARHLTLPIPRECTRLLRHFRRVNNALLNGRANIGHAEEIE